MSDTYNPIISRKPLERWKLFQSRPVPDPGTALVLSGDSPDLRVVQHGGQRLSNGELRWRRYNVLYVVDMTEHMLRLKCTLPCHTDAFDFQADVQFICCVQNPQAIVQRNVTDARQMLEPLIIGLMRDISREFDVEQSAEAERAIRTRIDTEKIDTGFAVQRFSISLVLDQDARARLRKRREAQEAIERESREAQEAFKRKRREVQEQLQINQDVDKLKMKEEISKIARTKVRMEFYREAIKAGDWEVLALQLAENPNDVASLMQLVNQQRQVNINLLLNVLNHLEDKGHKIDPIVIQILQEMSVTEAPQAALGSNNIEQNALEVGSTAPSTSSTLPTPKPNWADPEA